MRRWSAMPATALTVRARCRSTIATPSICACFGKTNLIGWTALLSSSGRTLRGAVMLDAVLRGRRQQPQAFGTATLQGGSYRDFAAGIGLGDIAATLVAEGDSIRLERFSAKARDGSLDGSGRIGLAGDLRSRCLSRLKMPDPSSRDDLTMTLDGEVSLQGTLKGNLTVAVLYRSPRVKSAFLPGCRPTSPCSTCAAVMKKRRRGRNPAESFWH